MKYCNEVSTMRLCRLWDCAESTWREKVSAARLNQTNRFWRESKTAATTPGADQNSMYFIYVQYLN